MAEWKPIRVTIHMGEPEIDRIGVFEAYTRGDDWNGFAVPYFTEDEGKRIMEWTRAMKERFPEGEVESVEWNAERQAFIQEDPQYPHEEGAAIPDEDVVAGFQAEGLGLTLYGIGTYKWTWEIVEELALVM